jgi:hypothetical protein
VDRNEPQVSVGGLLEQGILGEKFDEREQKTWKDDHERTKEEACARK